ncbi:carbohydrate binding domain-containing protein [Microbacterium sp. NPDC090007]|uniref:carbohydrate binding domain-containing protein n=1 Tax=Microbacterium sp. NPDC090007 TaxID=3364204 RepID=UPI00381D5CE0
MTATPRPTRRSRGIAVVALAGVAATGLMPTAAHAAETVDTLYAFEDGVTDHIQWGAAGAGIQPISEAGVGSFSDAPNNGLLSYGFDLAGAPGYGGIGFEYSGSRPAENWSAYDGLQFWMHSDGSDSSIQVEILDALGAEPGASDRWDVIVPVGEAGWRLVRLPFESFGFATDFQDAGAPADGTLDLSFVRGLLFPANSGTAVLKLDEIALYADAAVTPSLGVTATTLDVVEGADAVVPVKLSAAAATDVTVDVATQDGTAVAGTDYTSTAATLTIPAGARDAQIVVPTLADDEPGPNRTFTVTLDSAAGATLGAASTTVTVRDDDAADGGTAPQGRVIEDFESDLRLGDPAAVPALGWFTAQGAGNAPSFGRIADDARPSAADGNEVLGVGFDTTSWAVLVDVFTTDGQTFAPQDWSAFTGFGFWMRGTNSGAPLFVDLLDNRNPDSTVDDAERFSTRFVDDFTGWRFIELPFADFTRKNIGNGAPDDGLTLSEMHGFGIGVEQSSPAVTPDIRFDDVTLFGTADPDRPVTLNVARAVFPVEEGADAQVALRLSRAVDTDVTVAYRTDEATDRTSTEDDPATADRDFISGSGTVTIPAGTRDAYVTVPTIDDGKAEVDETFLVRFSDARGAELNPLALARVSITDTDPLVDGLLDDFENGAAGLDPLGGVDISTREIAASGVDSYAGQEAYENVLDVTGSGGFAREFAQPQDWSDRAGLGFWFDGRGDGRDVTVRVQDGDGAAAAPEDWELRWADEFDGAAGTPADPRYWTYETGGWGWGNDELQYYTDSTDNAAHDGQGNMVITTRAVEDPAAAGLECWYGPCTHTSARLITEDKYAFQYGRVEARAQMPDGEAGIWPAIWSLGDDFREVGWPRTGEIDIMEYVGKLPNEIFGTIHGPGYSGGQAYGDTYDFGEDLSNQWLTFAVEWEQGEIRWYVQRDGGPEILFHRATPADVAPDEWVYEHPFSLIMNMAVGGNFGGALADTLAFPQELAVDYIRVYQTPDTAERFETTFVDDQPGWRWVEVPFTAFDRVEGQPEGAPDDGLGLGAVTGYGIEIAADDAAVADRVSFDRVQLRDVISDAEPGDGVPGDGVPGDGVPGDGVPGDSVPGDSAPGGGVPGGAGSGDGGISAPDRVRPDTGVGLGAAEQSPPAGGLAATGAGDGLVPLLVALGLLGAGAVTVGVSRRARRAD